MLVVHVWGQKQYQSKFLVVSQVHSNCPITQHGSPCKWGTRDMLQTPSKLHAVFRIQKQPKKGVISLASLLVRSCKSACSVGNEGSPETGLQSAGSLAILLSPFFFWGTSMVAMKASSYIHVHQLREKNRICRLESRICPMIVDCSIKPLCKAES